MHPQLAAGALDDRRREPVVVGVGVRADQQPHVLEPAADLRERALQLLERALLVDAGVDQHDAVAGLQRPRVHVGNAGPRQRQPQPPDAREHAVGAPQLAPALRVAHAREPTG